MRVVWCGVGLLLALGAPLRAEVTVRAAAGRVDITANAAPLADVLDRLARQTGMKVVYEGPAPRQLVTVSLLGRSPAEAVHDLLEGQGLNYALLGDSAGTGVQTLLMTGQAAASASASSASSSSSAPQVLKPRGGGAPPPMSSPDGIEEAEDEPDEEPEPAPPTPGAPNAEGLPGAPNPGGVPPGSMPPGVGPTGAANPLLPLLQATPGFVGATPPPTAPVQNAPALPRTMAPTIPGFVPVNPLSPLGPFAPVIPANPGSPAGTPGSATEPPEPKEPPL